MCGASTVSASERLTISNNMSQFDQFCVGVIGCGQIGTAVTLNLLKSGCRVFVFDLNKAVMDPLLAQGAKGVASALELPAHCNVIITCLQRAQQVAVVMEGSKERGIEGLMGRMKRGDVWIEHTTTDFNQVLRMNETCKQLGIRMLEAPLTGGLQLLKQGTMTVYIGAGEDEFQRCLPIFKAYTGQQILTGAVSTATIIKVVSNMLAGVNTVAMGEALMIAKKANINLSTMFDAIRASAGNSYVWETECPVVFNGSFHPGFAIELHCKDLRLGNDIARTFDVPMPVNNLVEKIYEETRVKYGDNEGSSSPPRLLQDATGQKLQTPGFDDWQYSVDRRDGGIMVVHKNRTDAPRAKL